jgi:hypothetical protein
MSTPKAVDLLRDSTLDDSVIADASLVAAELAKPMDNTDFELVWRKRMVHTLVSGALHEVRGDDVSEARRGWRDSLCSQSDSVPSRSNTLS